MKHLVSGKAKFSVLGEDGVLRFSDIRDSTVGLSISAQAVRDAVWAGKKKKVLFGPTTS